MNSEIKKEWLAALRSGEYTQGRGNLHLYNTGKPDTFCCLGVLCDIHSKSTGVGWTRTRPDDCMSNYLGSDIVLPEAVRVWAGLEDHNPELTILDSSCSIATHNDDEESPRTFLEIADGIEKDY